MKTDQYSLLKEKINYNNFSSISILVDENTDKFCLDIFLKKSEIKSFDKIIIRSGEQYKNIDTCLFIWGKLNSNKSDRKSLLINLGGGVLTDIGGFAASTYLRGISFLNVPTTLLGMVDAAHGGKTGIDFKSLKNQIGLFSDPLEVILDSEYLKTLSKGELINGYAEVLKHSLLTENTDLNFNSLINLNIYDNIDYVIDNYSKIKNEVVDSDRFEFNRRKILNLGHTIGHAVESFSHIEDDFDELKHGEAIVIGLITELYISHKLLGFPKSDLDNFSNHILRYFKKTSFNDRDLEKIYDYLVYDKKNEGNKVNFVLLKNIGEPVIDQKVDNNLFKSAFKFYNQVL